jgi:hypothetical protein
MKQRAQHAAPNTRIGAAAASLGIPAAFYNQLSRREQRRLAEELFHMTMQAMRPHTQWARAMRSLEQAREVLLADHPLGAEPQR